MSKPILSICIPTANRKDYLENVLESIISQETFLNGEVEIVISDNSDNELTKEMVLRFQNSGIRYNNTENIYGINFAKSLSLGNGIYRKLVNDTLYYKDGSLADVFSPANKSQGKN